MPSRAFHLASQVPNLAKVLDNIEVEHCAFYAVYEESQPVDADIFHRVKEDHGIRDDSHAPPGTRLEAGAQRIRAPPAEG